MDALDVLTAIRQHGTITGDGEKLKVTVSSPMPDELQAEIRRHKPELLEALATVDGTKRLFWRRQLEMSRDTLHPDYHACMAVIRVALERRQLRIEHGRLRFDAIGLEVGLVASLQREEQRILALLDIAALSDRLEKGMGVLLHLEQHPHFNPNDARYRSRLELFIDLHCVYEVVCMWAEARMEVAA